MDPKTQQAQIRAQPLVMCTARSEIQLKVQGALGEASLAESVYGPIFDLMSDGKIRTIEDIETALSGLSRPQLLQAITVSVGQSILQPATTQPKGAPPHQAAKKLNQYLLCRAQGSSDVQYLASAVTGGGVQVNRFQQLFIDSIQSGKLDPAAWADDAWNLLRVLGQRLLKNGSPLETDHENVAELKAQAEAFANSNLPVLRALDVVD